LMVLRSRPAPLHDKSNRVTRWSVPVTPPPAAALADTLGRRKDRSDQSHDSPLLDPELLRRVGQHWSSPLVVPSDQLSPKKMNKD
jgi:hypothetical protein